MSVVVVPPTPRKASPQTSDADLHPAMGISSQILPLSRLSLSSGGGGGGISPASSQDSSNAHAENKAANSDTNSSGGGYSGLPPPPSSSSSDASGDSKADPKLGPVKDKLLKLRKSFTEPLVQYFQDLQASCTDL